MISEELLKSHKLIHSLTEIVLKLNEHTPLSPGDGRRCLTALLALQALESTEANKAVRELSNAIEKKLFWEIQPGQPLSREEKNSLIKDCEAIKIHILAVATWFLAQKGAVPAPTTMASTPNTAIDTGAVTFGLGGLTYTTFQQHMIILFSSIRTTEESFDVIFELSRVYDLTPPNYHWVMDFSGAKELPPNFMHILESYNQQLNRDNRKLLVCWLNPKLLIETDQELIERLGLVMIGGYYFTATH